MATNLLWFVLAGFLLGFVTSTLWEWFYFRKERLKLTDRRIRELEAKLLDSEPATESITPISTTANSAPPANAPITSAALTSSWGDPTYRSPGVFLETEDLEAVDGQASFAGNEAARPQTPASTNALTPNPPTVASVAPASPTETPVVPRNETSPADALRIRRGDSPRTRQEVLAALRRSSEMAQKGTMPRPETQNPPLETPPPASLQQIAPESPIAAPSTEPPPAFVAAAPTSAQEATATTALPAARQRWLNNPELTRRTAEYPDDLCKIKGIGDVYKQRLYRAGIYTWKQIAENDVETLRRATSAYPSSNVEEWQTQAQTLMEKFGRTDAVYTGPPPDDMTKILGIGPVGAAVLYRAGICTYEQLASTSIADLEALFPVAVAGDQPDFKQWLSRGAGLADKKYEE
jgi:predicted flap endonuclease-1-like 5' DNA nuclease